MASGIIFMLNTIRENLLWFISWTTGGRVNKFSDFYKTAPGLRIACLLLVIVAFCGYKIYAYRAEMLQRNKLPGVITLCTECGKYEERSYSGSVEKIRCSKCGGKVGEAWHCLDCHKDFPLVTASKIENSGGKFKTMDKARKAYGCPHCGSDNTEGLRHGNR